MKLKLWIWLLALVAGPAFPHGGGLNAEGCHNNRKTGDYHCHRAKLPDAASRALPESARAAPATTQQPSQPTCYTGPRGGTYTITKSGRKNYAGC